MPKYSAGIPTVAEKSQLEIFQSGLASFDIIVIIHKDREVRIEITIERTKTK